VVGEYIDYGGGKEVLKSVFQKEGNKQTSA
jgi:hypothetical protein